jgi:diguanylate cyclase (GGDEF)-like protein
MNTTSPAKVIGLDSYRSHTDQGEELTNLSKLALKLQQSIEISPLMHTFCEQTAQIVPCDSVSYKSFDGLLNFSVGEQQDHHCKYRLELESEELGEILCSRDKPFSIRETDLLERLLSLLIYPLRNALLYQSAIAQAHRDPLTKISNRAAFDEAIDKELSSYRRHQADFSLMIIDIDHFKVVNDTYGHIAGDMVLKSVAEVIQNTIRRSDEAFRYGGEEFVVILSNTKQGGARFIAERVRKQIEKLEVNLKEKIKVTASIGISSSEIMKDVTETLEFADQALYKAKDAGRNKVVSCP